MGTPRPTAIMMSTSAEMESTGGAPAPSSTVLQETHEEEFIRRPITFKRRFKFNAPAEELGAVVERFSCQPKAHVQPVRLWLCVERSDQTGCSRHCLAALRRRVRVMARRGVLQSGMSLPVRHRLPLNETRNVSAAVHRWNPVRHLRGEHGST